MPNAIRLRKKEATDLNIVLSKLLCKSSPGCCRRVHRVVYGDLAIFMVQPRIDVLAAALQNLLPQHNGCRRSVGEEVVFGHGASRDRRAAVVAQMKDACFDAQPRVEVRKRRREGKTRRGLGDHTIGDTVTAKRICVWMQSVVSATSSHIRIHILGTDTHVLPRAGRPTITIAIRPEWNSRPDMVL